MSKKTSGVVAFLALCGLSFFLLNCGSTVNRSSGLLYVLIQGSNEVSSYAVNLSSGNLSLINSNASTCPTATSNPPVLCGLPLDIVLDPKGSVAFVLDQGFPDPDTTHVPPQATPPAIYAYTVNNDGSLSAPGSPVTLSQKADNDTAVATVRDPEGKFLFVVNHGTIPSPLNCPHDPTDPNGNDACPSISVFATQPGSTSVTLTGNNCPSTTTPCPKRLSRIATALSAITFTPPGGSAQTLLFATANQDLRTGGHDDNTLTEYTVDASGNLSEYDDPNTGLPYTTAGNPSAVLAVQTSPIGGLGGLFIYVASATTNSVSAFQLCTFQNANCSAQDVTNLRLLPVGTPVTVGSNPVAMVVDPMSNFLFVVSKNSSQVFGFRINATEGRLTALSPANLSTGSAPVAIAMHSSGKFLFVSNSASSNLSSYTVDTTSGSMSSPLTITTSNANPAGLVSR